ncbi:MAG: cation diffusion facilitator family transporter [Deltaproteobacteria bacterium]
MSGNHDHAHGDGSVGRTAIVTIVVAFLVMGLKYVAYLKTGSAALYSDALESIVNVVTGVAALIAVRISAIPPDGKHPFGHHKAEFFSAVLEGALIVVAAVLIFQEAYEAWLNPRTLTEPAQGLAINMAAAAINAGWAGYLISRGKAWKSPALSAGGWHILTDVATSVGVLAGLLLSLWTGITQLDPILAALVGANILWAGYRITMSSMSSLLDEAASSEDQDQIRAAIQDCGAGAIQAHDIRTRHAGRVTFIEFHLVVPGAMTVLESHTICDRIEESLKQRIPGSQIVIHVEPDHKAKDKGAVAVSS